MKFPTFVPVLLLLLTSLRAASTPPAGTVILPPDASRFRSAIWVEDKTTASFSLVPAKDRAFVNAVQLSVSQPAPEAWQIGVSADTVAPVKSGDILWVTLEARALKTSGPGREGFADLVFMLKDAAGKEVRPLERRFTCSRDWSTTSIPFVINHDADAGKAKLVIRYGGAVQKLEVGGITLINAGPGADIAALPKAGAPYTGYAPDAPWRAAAAERIERLRKGPLDLRVVDAAGNPVREAVVSVRLRRHGFGFGASVDAKRMVAHRTPEDARYRELIDTYFSRIVFANDLKWGRWMGQKPAARQDILDALAWANERNIGVRGHVMVWPSWQYTPKFLRDLEKNPEALQQAVSSHIKAQTALYADAFQDWDVVNETFRHNDLIKILGRGILTDWFKEAYAGAPATRLFYNDYVLFSGTTPESPSQYLYDLIKELREKGAPISGLGEQGHFIGNPPGPDEILAALDRFEKLGLPITITEFDINTPDEQLQADFTRDFLTAAFSHPAVHAVMHWEFWENPEGNPAACLWRKDGTIRAPGQAWIDLTSKTWNTQTEGKTVVEGQYSTRGFFGDYVITIRHQGRTKTLTIKHTPEGKPHTITAP